MVCHKRRAPRKRSQPIPGVSRIFPEAQSTKRNPGRDIRGWDNRWQFWQRLRMLPLSPLRFVNARSQWVAVLLLLGALGCSSDQPESGDAYSDGSPKPVVTELSIPEVLPPMEEPRRSFEGGRIMLSHPEGWKWLPKRDQYLISFVRSQGSTLPRLELHSQKTKEPDLTSKTAKEWAEKLLAEKRSQRIEVHVTQLGGHPAVYERLDGKTSKYRKDVVKRRIVTRQGGYEVSLEVVTQPSDAEEYLPWLLALAEDLTFTAAEDSQNQTSENPSDPNQRDQQSGEN